MLFIITIKYDIINIYKEMVILNIISLAISTFIVSSIIMAIINVLPIRKKRLWDIIIISIYSLGELGSYLLMFLYNINDLNLIITLEIISSILGIIIGYIAIMMIILDGIKIFKSKRLKEFERNLNNKDSKSIPKWIFSIISGILCIILLIIGLITTINYTKSLLISIIGLYIGFLIFLLLSIYLFITGLSKHKNIKASNLLFIVDFENHKYIYTSTINKEFSINDALGSIQDVYLIDEYGLLITPIKHYVVMGIKLEYSGKKYLDDINMEKIESNEFDEIISKYQKYNKKRIEIDEFNNIKSIKIIK